MQGLHDLVDEARQPASPDRADILQAIEDIVAGMQLPLKRSFDPRCDFQELGLDSLAIVELVAETELRYSLVIEDGDYRQIRSADAFATYLLGRLG